MDNSTVNMGKGDFLSKVDKAYRVLHLYDEFRKGRLVNK